MNWIPKSHQDLVSDEKKAIAFLATTMPDGTPHVTPVWFSVDDKHILINTAAGRVKARNMRARPQAALAIADPDNPYRYLAVRGRIAEITEEGADDHIHTLSYKYLGRPWSIPGEEVRLQFKIAPERVYAG